MLGLDNNEVILVEYDPNWEKIANSIINKLSYLLNDVILGIEHIGSTAIKKIKSKPIIDIVVGVNKLEDIFKYKIKLEKEGFIFGKSNRPNEEVLLVLNDNLGKTMCLIHVVIFKSDVWNRTVLFRDAVNDSEELRKIYSDKKEELFLKYKNNRKQYTKEKAEVIEFILEKINNE